MEAIKNKRNVTDIKILESYKRTVINYSQYSFSQSTSPMADSFATHMVLSQAKVREAVLLISLRGQIFVYAFAQSQSPYWSPLSCQLGVCYRLTTHIKFMVQEIRGRKHKVESAGGI
jgi:hypothetical protein